MEGAKYSQALKQHYGRQEILWGPTWLPGHGAANVFVAIFSAQDIVHSPQALVWHAGRRPLCAKSPGVQVEQVHGSRILHYIDCTLASWSEPQAQVLSHRRKVPAGIDSHLTREEAHIQSFPTESIHCCRKDNPN